jgi:hypothetical protein
MARPKKDYSSYTDSQIATFIPLYNLLYSDIKIFLIDPLTKKLVSNCPIYKYLEVVGISRYKLKERLIANEHFVFPHFDINSEKTLEIKEHSSLGIKVLHLNLCPKKVVNA